MKQSFSKARLAHEEYIASRRDFLEASAKLEELDNKLAYLMGRLKEVEEKQHSNSESGPLQRVVDDNIDEHVSLVAPSPTSSINGAPSTAGNEVYGLEVFCHNSSESFP